MFLTGDCSISFNSWSYVDKCCFHSNPGVVTVLSVDKSGVVEIHGVSWQFVVCCTAPVVESDEGLCEWSPMHVSAALPDWPT